jgi:hypothetical protein
VVSLPEQANNSVIAPQKTKTDNVFDFIGTHNECLRFEVRRVVGLNFQYLAFCGKRAATPEPEKGLDWSRRCCSLPFESCVVPWFCDGSEFRSKLTPFGV